MLYSYRVRDKLGNINEGYLEADNHLTVINHLLQSQYLILNLNEEKIKNNFWHAPILLLGEKKISVRELSNFMRQLATMINANLPIIKSFEILAGQMSNHHLRKVAAKIEASLRTGLSLHEAMALHKQIFSRMHISMVKAGETGGILPVVLLRIAEQLERERQINDKVKSASVYPAIVVIVASIAIVFILTFILPSFVQSFSASGTELPLFTAWVLSIGNFIGDHLLLLLLIIAVTTIGLSAWGRTIAGRLFFDRFYIKLPWVGNVINKVAVAKFTRTLGMLISSGIPILTAFQVLEGVVGNQIIANAIGEAREKIKEGQSIASPLNKTGLFEPMVTQMIAVGEETGTLDNMLERMAIFYDIEVTYAIDSLMSIIEPLLIIIVALIIGAIIVAIYLPVFNLVTTMGI